MGDNYSHLPRPEQGPTEIPGQQNDRDYECKGNSQERSHTSASEQCEATQLLSLLPGLAPQVSTRGRQLL